MRQHGIRESSYYYWHKILLNNGMLDDKDTSHLEGIELPPAIGHHELETQTGFVEYHASGPQICMCADQLETHRYPAQIMIEKAEGNNYKAVALATAFCADFGKYELEMERYYDHMMMVHAMNGIFNTKSAAEYAQ